MTAKKGVKRSSTKGKRLGHFAVSTEESRHHEAPQSKRETIARAHKEEYSAEHSHSMSHVEMFRSHAGTKSHQRDLRKAEQHMGISVNVQRNVKAALKEREQAEKEAVAQKMKMKVPVNLRVNTSSPAVKRTTIPRPYSLSSPRCRTPTVTSDNEVAISSPSRSSTKDANVVKYHATEAGGRLATVERILSEQMIRLKTLSIRIHAQRTSHDDNHVARHAHGRAADLVKAELSEIQAGLDKLQGPAVQNKYTAMSTMFVRLNHELEGAVLTDEHVKRKHMTYEESMMQEERERQLDAHLRDLATKDQRLNQLERDLAQQVESNESLARTNEALSKELEKLNRNQLTANQNAVELRMQGLDYKARVENRLNRVLHSIQTRLGFVPAGITKEIKTLNNLKAPGDPHYNDILHHAYTKNSLKKMQKMLGDIPAISGMFDESDVLVDPYSGKMTLLDGTPVADKTEAEKQEAKDRLRMVGYSPARAKGHQAHHIPSPLPAGEGRLNSGNTSSAGTEELNRSELIESGQKSKSLLPPRSPEGARVIAGRARPPRSQEEWVQWALNKTNIDLPSSMKRDGSRLHPTKGDDGVNRKSSVSSSVWAEPGTDENSEDIDSAPAGEIEMQTYQDFADDMDDEEDSEYEPYGEDEGEEGEEGEEAYGDDDYVREKVTAVQRGGFYELESVSTEDVEEIDDLQSYEAGKSKTAAALANAAGSSTYIDPRASVRSSVSSLGEAPATVAWKDPAVEQQSTDKQISETAAELSDIRAFLSHVRTQRGIAESELQAFMKK